MTPHRLYDIGTLVGTAEIADRLDVSPNTVYSWIQRGQFPERLLTITGTPIWDWETVHRWAIETGRFPVTPAV